HADHADVAFADLAGPLHLDLQLPGRSEARAGDATGAVVILLVSALAHVEAATKHIFFERIRPLIHRVPRDRRNRAALLRQQRRNLYVLHRYLAQHRLLAGVGFGTEGSALQDLSVIIRQSLGESGANGWRRKDRAVAATPTNDHIGAFL